jgi:flagellar motor switch/type III secretory pathway protein FliN
MSAPEPLNIAYLQQKLPKPEGAASSSGNFFAALANSIALEMQLYNTVPVRCSIFRERKFNFPETEDKQRDIFTLLSKQNKLRIWYEADRSFDHLLCELCMGGTGVPEPEEDGVRPPSSFEKRFKANVLRKLLAAVPIVAKRANNAELEVAVETAEDQEAPPEKLAGKPGLEVTFEVCAFSCTAAITLQFLETELSECLATPDNSATPKTTAKDVLGGCLFGFEAFLKSREVPLAEIISLQVGQVISLEITISDPLTVACEGKLVFHGTMNLQGKKIQIALRAEADTGQQKILRVA